MTSLSVGTTYSQQTHTIHESRRSVKDMMISVRPNDQYEDDSCYIHAITTTYKASEILNIINKQESSATYNFFYDFNVELPG